MNNVEFFKENGYVVLEKAISDDLIDRYIDSWNKEHSIILTNMETILVGQWNLGTILTNT